MEQANDKSSAGCVRLDINFLKPSRLEFAQDPCPDVTLPEGAAETPKEVGVCLQDGAPCPALAAHQAGGVDWLEYCAQD